MSIRSEAKKLANNRNWVIGTAQVASVVVFPILEAVLLKYQASLGWLFLGIGIPIVLLHLAFGLFVFFATRNEAFYFEFEDAQADIDRLENRVQTLNKKLRNEEVLREDTDWVRETTQIALHLMQAVIDIKGILDDDALKEATMLVLNPFVKNREHVFSFKDSARFNISVYRYEADQNLLTPFVRFVDDRISRSDRQWRPGTGHIGICFSQDRTIVSGDVLEAPILAESLSEGDAADYRSMASIPIPQREGRATSSAVRDATETEEYETEHPRGVFIVTSSRADQLSTDAHGLTMETIATLLALLFDYAEIS